MDFMCRDIQEKKVICEDLTVGKVKGVLIDSEQWKATHLEVQLTRDAAELVLGIRKGGIKNLLAVSAVETVDKTVNLKVSKGQLNIYLKAPKL